jgi:hypothetical protein
MTLNCSQVINWISHLFPVFHMSPLPYTKLINAYLWCAYVDLCLFLDVQLYAIVIYTCLRTTVSIYFHLGKKASIPSLHLLLEFLSIFLLLNFANFGWICILPLKQDLDQGPHHQHQHQQHHSIFGQAPVTFTLFGPNFSSCLWHILSLKNSRSFSVLCLN